MSQWFQLSDCPPDPVSPLGSSARTPVSRDGAVEKYNITVTQCVSVLNVLNMKQNITLAVYSILLSLTIRTSMVSRIPVCMLFPPVTLDIHKTL
jgi:hypothetical protein